MRPAINFSFINCQTPVAMGLNIPVNRLLENIEFQEGPSTDISFEIYQLLLTLPPDKQKQLGKIIREIVGLLT